MGPQRQNGATGEGQLGQKRHRGVPLIRRE
jgi:hypothetical protein